MSDPFEDLGAIQISNPVQARRRAAEKRRQKQLQERDLLYRQWKKWHEERTAELLAGPFGAAASEVSGFVEGMKLEDGLDLIALIERGPWRQADADTKFLLLGMIDRAIMYLRENAGLEPIDDALPGEPLTVGLMIKKLLE
jgi:hypothetical protein